MSNNNEKGTKLFKNTIWFSLGTFLSKAITFFLVPFYTSILTKSEYSISDIISTTVSLVLPFFSLVISNAVCRFALDKKGDYSRIFSVGLIVILIGFVPLTVGSYIVFQLISSIKNFWVYFVLIYLLSAISTLQSEFLKGLEKVRVLTFANIMQTLSFVVSNIFFLLFLKLRIEGYLLSYIVSYTIVVFIYLFMGRMHRFICNPLRKNNGLSKNMIKYSIPLIPNSAMWWITNSSDRYFVASMVSISANGLLSIAYKIPSILSIFIGVFHSAWELSVVEDFDNEKGRSFFCSVYEKYIQFNVVVAAFLILFSKLLGKLLYSADFFEAWKYSAILIVGYSFHAMAGFIGYVFTTVKKTQELFFSTLVGAILNIVLNYILIKYFGIVGAVLATNISYFVTFLLRRKSAKKYIDIKIDETSAVISFLLLIIETIIMCMDFRFSWIASFALFILVAILNFKFVKTIFVIVKKSIYKILGR